MTPSTKSGYVIGIDLANSIDSSMFYLGKWDADKMSLEILPQTSISGEKISGHNTVEFHQQIKVDSPYLQKLLYYFQEMAESSYRTSQTFARFKVAIKKMQPCMCYLRTCPTYPKRTIMLQHKSDSRKTYKLRLY